MRARVELGELDRNAMKPKMLFSVAAMAELADAQDSGSCVRKDVEVRLLLAA